MNDKVDVLAFLDRETRRFNPEHAESARQARAAIAELIEVAKDARDSLLAANKAYSDGAIGILIERLSGTVARVVGA